MRQAQWTETGIEVADVSRPHLPEGWVRVKVHACGICGSDLHSYHRDLPVTPGGVPGHEVCGFVEAGPAGMKDGLYAVQPKSACGSCRMCLSGRRHICPRGVFMGGAALKGGLAEFVDAPADLIFSVSPSVSPLVASMAEPVAVCVRGIHLARPGPDSRVLILGAGTIGLLTGLLARSRVGQVGITARYPQQRDAAQRFGLTPLDESGLDAWTREGAPDIVIETVGGNANTLGQAVNVCGRGGRIVVLGVFTGEQSIHALKLVVEEIEIVGSIVYGSGRRGREFGAAVSLLSRYAAELSTLQTHQFPLSNIKDAFEAAANKKAGGIKVTVVP